MLLSILLGIAAYFHVVVAFSPHQINSFLQSVHHSVGLFSSGLALLASSIDASPSYVTPEPATVRPDGSFDVTFVNLRPEPVALYFQGSLDPSSTAAMICQKGSTGKIPIFKDSEFQLMFEISCTKAWCTWIHVAHFDSCDISTHRRRAFDLSSHYPSIGFATHADLARTRVFRG